MSKPVPFACFVAIAILGVGIPTTAAADAIQVDQLTFPVRLSDGNDYEITGYYYHRPNSKKRVLQVTVHGATHYHLYWDLGTVNGVDYSYARYMVDQGYDVLAIDQLGTGASSLPDGDFLGLAETASGLHQVLASLRENHNPTGHKHDKIALVGHSNGSLTSIYATGTYHDADALVTTAWEHVPHPLPFDPNAIISSIPKYIPATLFSEGFWIGLFYYVPSTDLQLVDFEYSHLGPAMQARKQFADLFFYAQNTTLTRSTQVTVPVLAQTGDFDLIQPSAIFAGEPAFYPNAASVELTFLENMGHNVNGHLNHLQSWTKIDAFVDAKLGKNGNGH
jgi:pimeloyl-ACP methyl ester carboxylesterase